MKMNTLKIETLRSRYSKLMNLDRRMKKAVAKIIKLARFDVKKMTPTHHYLVARFAAEALGHSDPFAHSDGAAKKIIRALQKGFDGYELKARVEHTLSRFNQKSISPSLAAITALLIVDGASIR